MDHDIYVTAFQLCAVYHFILPAFGGEPVCGIGYTRNIILMRIFVHIVIHIVISRFVVLIPEKLTEACGKRQRDNVLVYELVYSKRYP